MTRLERWEGRRNLQWRGGDRRRVGARGVDHEEGENAKEGDGIRGARVGAQVWGCVGWGRGEGAGGEWAMGDRSESGGGAIGRGEDDVIGGRYAEEGVGDSHTKGRWGRGASLVRLI